MKKYNVFRLWVVKEEDYYFICEKSLDENIYTEIFTKEKLEVLDNENVEPLKNYYSLLAIKSYSTKEPLMMTTKKLLLKYAEINSSHIERKKQDKRNDYKTIIKEQEEYICALKELAQKNPEKSKEEAIEHLRRVGILDENNKLAPAYSNNISSKNEVENSTSIERGRTLTRNNGIN